MSILQCNTHLSGFVCKVSIICSFQIYSRILIQVRHFLSFLNIKKKINPQFNEYSVKWKKEGKKMAMLWMYISLNMHDRDILFQQSQNELFQLVECSSKLQQETMDPFQIAYYMYFNHIQNRFT